MEFVCRGKILGYACTGRRKASNVAARKIQMRVNMVKDEDGFNAQGQRHEKSDAEIL